MRVKPKKKRLGQNFLVDRNIQRKIINACSFDSSDIVLEIGSGRAEMTRLIAERVKKVYALEIDRGLCPILKANTQEYKNVAVTNGDILKIDLKKYLGKNKKKIKGTRRKS